MFKKKYKFTVEIDRGLTILNNIDINLPKQEIENLIVNLINGNLGRTLLDELGSRPEFRELSNELYLKLTPLPIIDYKPIIEPSQVLNIFANQVKNLMQ